MNTVHAIAEILRREDVDFIACVPTNPLIEAAATAGIRPIVCRQERTGVHIADGYSRVGNGRPAGVFAMQAGPGAENAFGAVAQAYADATPILLLPSGVPVARRAAPPSFDAVRCYGPITRWADFVDRGSAAPELMKQAIARLRSGRRGPVLLEIPTDVAEQDIGADTIVHDPAAAPESPADPGDVRRVVEALLAAERPVLHAGQDVLYADASSELVALAEALDAPVMTTLLGKSGFPEDHPLSLGTGASSSPDCVPHFLERADLICGVGCSFFKSSFAVMIPEDVTLIHITPDRRGINRDYTCGHSIVGDAKHVLGLLVDEIRHRAKGGRPPAANGSAAEIAVIRDRWLARWRPKLESDEVPINPYRVIRDTGTFFQSRDVIVIHDSGSAREQVVPFWPAVRPRSFIGWGKSTQLGCSLGFAMGAKLAAPDKHVIHFMGDGAFGMVGMDIETAVRAEIPIITILLNNSTMGIYPDSEFPVAVRRHALKRMSGNYAQVARALGAHAERIVAPGEIIPALERAVTATTDGRTAVLEFITKEERCFSNCTLFDDAQTRPVER